jgi:DNA-binding GntR family transcriptional regulator
VLHLRRLRFAHGEPLAVMENYLPEDLIAVGEMDLVVHGPYSVLRSKGVNIRVAKTADGPGGHPGGMPTAG